MGYTGRNISLPSTWDYWRRRHRGAEQPRSVAGRPTGGPTPGQRANAETSVRRREPVFRLAFYGDLLSTYVDSGGGRQRRRYEAGRVVSG